MSGLGRHKVLNLKQGLQHFSLPEFGHPVSFEFGKNQKINQKPFAMTSPSQFFDTIIFHKYYLALVLFLCQLHLQFWIYGKICLQQISLPTPKSRKSSRLFPPISENWAKYPSSNLMKVTEQELKFSIQDFLIKCDQILQFSPAFVTFMEEIYNESFIRCAVGLSSECFKKIKSCKGVDVII